jgi:hypothetical protein
MPLEYGPGEDAKDPKTGRSQRPKVMMVRMDKNGNKTLAGPFPREHRDRYLNKGFKEWDGSPLPKIQRSKAPIVAASEAAEHLTNLVGRLAAESESRRHEDELKETAKRGPGRPKKVETEGNADS